MLVLTRKINEKLIINGNIEVVILDATKNSVRIGINAPIEVQVHREEIYSEIQKANKQSETSELKYIDEIQTNKPKSKNKFAFDLTSKFKKNG